MLTYVSVEQSWSSSALPVETIFEFVRLCKVLGMTHKYGDVYFVVLLYHTFSLFLLSPKPVSVLLDHCGLSHRSFPLLSLLQGKLTFQPLQIMSSFPMITDYSQKVTHLSLINQHEQCWVQMVFWPKQ